MAWAAGRAIAVRTGDGYVVEAFVKREDVFLAPGAFVSTSDVGIDVSVNVAAPVDAAGTCGRRLGQYFLNATNRSEPPERERRGEGAIPKEERRRRRGPASSSIRPRLACRTGKSPSASRRPAARNGSS